MARALWVSLFCLCALRVCNSQGLSVAVQNKYQCWTGVDITGTVIQTVTAKTADDCARRCLAAAGCTLFSLSRSLQCTLKMLPFDSAEGATGVSSSIRTSCLLKTVGGSLPSPADVMCYSGQDVAGNELSRSVTITTYAACASLCIATPGCSFSVFRPNGPSGNGSPLCQLKSNAFSGTTQTAAATKRDVSVTALCLRATPAPQVTDPLLAVAGPVPFLITAKLTGRCLRMPQSPYSAGQPPIFMADCSGVEALWTYDAATQILRHHASGLCLAPADSSNGALVSLSSACGTGSGAQVWSRNGGRLQALLGARWIQPAGENAYEGAMMVASRELPQELYTFVPSAGLDFQCFLGVDIAGDVVDTYPTVSSSLACAALCEASAACTFYAYEAASVAGAGKCHLRSSPFAGGATRSSAMAASCLKKSASGTLPSSANYMCYSGQRVSGTVMMQVDTANPQLCSNMCTAASGCAYSLYTLDGKCTIGMAPFFGAQGNDQNVEDEDVIQLCLRANGAQDTVFKNGYVCFGDADIAGELVGTALQVASTEACARKCEEMSELCTFSVYTSNSLCILKADAFFGEFGATGRAQGKTACLRSQSGGTKNSPPNFLCYGGQSLSGTEILRGAGVADAYACAEVCASTPKCTLSIYTPTGSGTCIIKKQPFYGAEGSELNGADPDVSGMCLYAPSAPEVLSGFGLPI